LGHFERLSDNLSALRDGLAHGFDTKHISVDSKEHQIYLGSRGPQEIKIVKNLRRVGLFIGVRALAESLCAKITEFEKLLNHDAAFWLRSDSSGRA
jgi:hypothetical protein